MGLFDLVTDAVEWTATTVVKTVDDVITDPIGTGARIVTQPVHDGIEIVEGMCEGELRVHAATRLGADIVAGMTISQLVEWYNE